MSSVCETVFRHLSTVGLRHIFLVPGDDPYMQLAVDDFFQPVVMRDERGAAFAAQIYGRLKGLGACMSSHGPGMSNLTTGLAAAFLEQDPVIALCSQLPRAAQTPYSHAFISEDILEPVTKQLCKISHPESSLPLMMEAIDQIRELPFGPVAYILPQDISASPYPPALPTLNDKTSPDPDSAPEADQNPVADEIIDRINRATEVLIIAGAAVVRDCAVSELRKFASKVSAICATTIQAKGTFGSPEEITISRHNLDNFLAGHRASLCLIFGVDKCEGLVNLPQGDQFVRFNSNTLTSEGKTQILGNLADVASFLTAKCASKPPKEHPRSNPRIFSHILEQAAATSSHFDGLICVDTGLYKHAWASYSFAAAPNRQIFSNGLSSIGWSLAAAIGAHFATGERVLAVIGDGGFSMAASELFPIKQYDLPVSVLIIEDNAYGMIQRLERDRLGHSTQSVILSKCDYESLAKTFGFEFVRITSDNIDYCFTCKEQRRCLYILHVDYSSYEFVHC